MDDQKPWAWYAGDGERFPHGPHETREDAIAEAFDNEEGFDDEDNVCRFEVMEAWQKTILFRALIPMDFDRMVEHWDDADGEQMERPAIPWEERNPWEAEPDFCRVVDGLPDDLDAERAAAVSAFGNAVVPRIPEVIGRAILQVHGLKSAACRRAKSDVRTRVL